MLSVYWLLSFSSICLPHKYTMSALGDYIVWIECTLCGFVTGLSTGSLWDNGISHNSLLWQDLYPHNKKGNPYRLQHAFWQLQTVWISSLSHSLDREQAWLVSCPHEQCLLLCTSAWPKYLSDFLFLCQYAHFNVQSTEDDPPVIAGHQRPWVYWAVFNVSSAFSIFSHSFRACKQPLEHVNWLRVYMALYLCAAFCCFK
jgi:hypothetical protein